MARNEVAPHQKAFKKLGWQQAIGASGTIRAVRAVLLENGWSSEGIPIDGLCTLVAKLAEFSHIDEVSIPGLSAERAPVFLGGVLVLLATFESLGIKQMVVSDCALREGLIHDQQGRIRHEDTRTHSVTNLAKRYHVDSEHAEHVINSAQQILKQLKKSWALHEENHRNWLNWAAQLHEVGLDIAHKHYHHHGAYVIEHTDLAGFSQQEQRAMSRLVRLHRRKFQPDLIADLPKRWQQPITQLSIILRLAFILNRSRSSNPLSDFTCHAEGKQLKIHFPENWLDENPLTHADLEQEAIWLAKAGFELSYQ